MYAKVINARSGHSGCNPKRRAARGAVTAALWVGLAIALALLTAPSTAKAKDIFVDSHCFAEFWLAIKYFDERRDQWRTKGWWRVSPWREFYLADDDGRLETRGKVLYFLIESRDPELKWSSDLKPTAIYGKGAKRFRIDGETRLFRRHWDPGYDLDLEIGCSDVFDGLGVTCEFQCFGIYGSCRSSKVIGWWPTPDGGELPTRMVTSNKECQERRRNCIRRCLSDTISEMTSGR